jgi:hypothetical protein
MGEGFVHIRDSGRCVEKNTTCLHTHHTHTVTTKQTNFTHSLPTATSPLIDNSNKHQTHPPHKHQNAVLNHPHRRRSRCHRYRIVRYQRHRLRCHVPHRHRLGLEAHWHRRQHRKAFAHQPDPLHRRSVQGQRWRRYDGCRWRCCSGSSPSLISSNRIRC